MYVCNEYYIEIYGDQHAICVCRESQVMQTGLMFRSHTSQNTHTDFSVNRLLTLLLRLFIRFWLVENCQILHLPIYSQVPSAQFCREGFSANRAKFMNQISDWLLIFPSQVCRFVPRLSRITQGSQRKTPAKGWFSQSDGVGVGVEVGVIRELMT